MQSPTTGASTFDAAQAFLKDRPKRNLFQARWMAVQIEPITFSGERITSGIAIVPDDGSAPRVIGTLRAEPLEQVFGLYGKHLFNLAGTVNAELQTFLATGGKLETWVPNMQGVYAGSVIPTRNTSLEAVVRSAQTHSSLFSAKGNDKPNEEVEDKSLGKFHKEIKRLVIGTREGFKERFNRPMELYGRKGKATISYVGTHLAINLSTLDPTANATYQCATAQRKITHLLRLRDIQIGHDHDELLLGIWIPRRDLTPSQESHLDSYTTELAYAAEKAKVGFEVAYGGGDLKEAARPFAKKILADA